MTRDTIPDSQTPLFEHQSTSQLVGILMLFVERPQIPVHVIARTVDPLRNELRRRETLGFEDPFESPYPEVTW